MLSSARANFAWSFFQECRLTALLLIISGCSSAPKHSDAFSAQTEIKGNTESLSTPMDVAWTSVLEVMAERGWVIQTADTQSHLILAHREMRDAEDPDLSLALTATVALFPTSDKVTRVMASANQTTEAHKTTHTWWHLLWIIPLFPVGTEYTTVVMERDTVHDPQLYADFFAAVKQKCEEASARTPPVSGS